LLKHLLKKNKFKCKLGGNIGTPILDLKNSKKSYVIIEASSSFNFHILKLSAQTTVFC